MSKKFHRSIKKPTSVVVINGVMGGKSLFQIVHQARKKTATIAEHIPIPKCKCISNPITRTSRGSVPKSESIKNLAPIENNRQPSRYIII